MANNRDPSVTSDVVLQAHLWRQISGIEVYEEKVKCKGLMDFLGSLDKKSKAEQVEVRKAGRGLVRPAEQSVEGVVTAVSLCFPPSHCLFPNRRSMPTALGRADPCSTRGCVLQHYASYALQLIRLRHQHLP